MKHNFFYVLFFFFILAISKNNIKNLKLLGTESKYKQVHVVETILENAEDSLEDHLEVATLKPITKEKKEVHLEEKVLVSVEKTKKTYKKNREENEASSVEFTLPEITVDNSHKIDYYYPYFYKTHIIQYQEVINYSQLTNDCRDIGCQWCDLGTKMTCSECRHGFFLYQGKCYTSCPEGYIADIFKKICSPMNNSSRIIIIFRCFNSYCLFEGFYNWFLQEYMRKKKCGL